MKVISDLSLVPSLQGPIVVTIGNFDGVHLGHQAVLRRVKDVASQQRTQSAVISFTNHSMTILKPDQPIKMLCSLEKKIKLMEIAGIDLLILIPFTYEFSQQTAENFLGKIHTSIPFSHLILGHDALLGKGRHGTQEVIRKIGCDLHFDVEYCGAIRVHETYVSSTKIREALREGKLDEVNDFLGRRFSIFGPVIKGLGLGKKLGYRTINLSVDHLCLPPYGVYAVEVLYEGKRICGAANLGIAPTVRHDNRPILEVHLLDFQRDLYGQYVEVLFKKFSRKEKTFPTLEELQRQIAADIREIRHLFNDTNHQE